MLVMITMIVTAFFVVLPEEVTAASGLPKVASLRANVRQTAVTISWKKLNKKQLKKVKGIAIYRNGSFIRNVGKKTGSYTDTGLKAGTSYSYSVKTYKKTKKKEWFNKKTQKWQKKKPAKGFRGKSRKIIKYSAAANVYITTTKGGTQSPVNKPEKQHTTIDRKQQTINYYGDKTLKVGQKYKLGASASSGLPLTYISEDPGIASVDSTGLVTANGYGTTSIHVRQEGNAAYSPAERIATIRVDSARVTIRFDGNGGTGSMTDQTLSHGSGTLDANQFTRDGFSFKGWSQDSNSSSPSYFDKGAFALYEATSTTVTLYAVWEKEAEDIVIRDPFAVNYEYKNGNVCIIDSGMGEVAVPMVIPPHVANITWKKSNAGLAVGLDTVSFTTADRGRRLTLKAEKALSNKGTLGQVKFTGTLEMEPGYKYYDESKMTQSFIVTNTVYPMMGSVSAPVYDYEVFNRGVADDSSRSLSVFSELPPNATVNIDIARWNGDRDNVGLRVNSDFDLKTPEADCNSILLMEKHWGKIFLIQAGKFKLHSDRYDKDIWFNLSGKGDYMLGYHNHLKDVAAQCKDSNEIMIVRNCIKYIYTHYYYSRSGNYYDNGCGDCGAAATFMERVLRYSGIEAYVRGAKEVSGQPNEHVNNAVILSDGSKYVADGTPSDHVYTEEEAEYWLQDEPGETLQDARNGCRICRWEAYNARYGDSLEFY